MGSRKPKNVAALLDWHAGRSKQTTFHLDRPFDIAPWEGTVIDGAAAACLVRDAAGWLHAAGARPGDRVAIVKDNHFDIQFLVAAAARIGAVPAALSSAAPADTLRHLITLAEPAVTVLSPSVIRALTEGGEKLPEAAGRIVVVGEDSYPESIGDVIHFEELRGGPEAPVRLRADDEPAFLCHTSGTTGLPKLVVHTTTTLYHATRLDTIPFPVLTSGHRDVYASAVSFAHARAAGTFTAQLSLAPAKLVILSNHEPDNAVTVLRNHCVTILEACPNIFLHWQPLTRTHPELFERIRLYFNTFDLIHPSTVRAFLGATRRRFPLWLQGWGQSETGPITGGFYNRTRVRWASGRSAVTSDIGWTVPGISRAKVVDPATGARQRIGQPGLLMARGKGRCVDYLGETERHREKVDGKWWNTGDLGYRDPLGRLRLLDREVDMIPGMSGIDVESLLLDRLEHATEVVVLGVPGRLPVPVLCLAGGALDEQLWARATRDLPPLGPPVVLPWDDVPRTSTWKVRRHALREQVLGTAETFGTGRWT